MSITDELREYAQGFKNSHDAWSGIFTHHHLVTTSYSWAPTCEFVPRTPRHVLAIKTHVAVVAALCVALAGCSSGGNGVRVDGLNRRADGRFEYEYVSGVLGTYSFGYVVDTETGVTYLVYRDGAGKNGVGGITVLLDGDGKPTIDPRYGRTDE